MTGHAHQRRALSPVTPLPRVLETGAGTGIVTRRLRDLLPATTKLFATDLNPPMLDVARKKFRPDEPVDLGREESLLGHTGETQAQINGTLV